MKLTRNKIRKIRKQQHQSVRKWKKARNSIRRKVATFRRSPLELIPKRKNVFNKTLKKYIPIPVLEYLKEKYLNMRRMRRKQRRMKMIGGEGDADAEPADAAADAEPADAAANAEPANAEPAAADAAANAAANAEPADAESAAAATNAEPAAADAEPADADADATTDASSSASSIAAAAVAAAKASNNTDNSGETGKEEAAASKEGADAGEEGTDASKEGSKDEAEAGKEGADAGKGDDGEKKKSASFSLGPDIPGDISIHSETHELKDVKLTWKLVEFLVKSCIPYYIQLELKGKVLNKHDTDIFDLRRILYGKYVTQENYKKAGDKQKLYFKSGTEIGVADGDSISSENNTDIFIFTGEKVSFDPKSKDNSIKLISAPKTPNENSFVVTDSKRLYQLSGDSPSSIDNMEDVGILGGNSIDISEFRLQVGPLSETDLKNAVATASSDDGDKKKRKKIVTDDTNSYVVNLSVGCKVTSIQTLRKSLEVARAALEDEDDVAKKDAMDIFKMINGLLQNPEFAKNDGFDDFKEQVFGFTYKIPGTERKYGIAQLMSFFEQEKDNLPKDLTKEFFKMLTLLGHGPAGENGACMAFDRPQSLEVIEYTKTLANGDIVTTKKLGSKTNLDGFGDEIDKLNASNNPKEEDEKNEGDAAKSEGDDAKKAEGADAKKAEGDAAKKAEGADAKKAQGDAAKKIEGAAAAKKTEGAAAAKKAPAAKAPAPAPAKSAASQKQAATAIAIAAISAAEANSDKPTAEHISAKEIPKEPVPPSQEVVAINKLYEKYAKKNEKVKRLLELRRFFTTEFKKILPLLIEIFTKSVESQKAWKDGGSNKSTPINLYQTTKQFKETKANLEKQLTQLKNSNNYRFIKHPEKYTDEVVSEFNPSIVFAFGQSRDLLIKMCKLIEKYAQIMNRINEAYEYFNDNQKMKGGVFGVPSQEDVVRTFNNQVSTFKYKLTDLDKEAEYTNQLEQQLLPNN
jgi:hypothetical protein